jgi:putative transposase
VTNRGNHRERVFHADADYQDFVILIGRACEEVPMRVLGFCLMPNHFHLALWPIEDGGLSRWMHWLLTAHVRRHNQRHEASGHVWQGRFKAFPAQDDAHLTRVLRYIERNPLRAGLVGQAAAWPWSSLRWWKAPRRLSFLHPTDTVTDNGWPDIVDSPDTQDELDRLRRCVNRGSPFGDPSWTSDIAERLGIEFTLGLRPRGRPHR